MLARQKDMPVKLKVKTDIRNGNEKETFELIAFGRYYQKENADYLQYDEIMDHGPDEPVGPPVKTTIKLTEDNGLILRSGAVKMRLPFQMNKRLPGNYATPYGTFEIETRTTRLSHEYDEDAKAGKIEILYEMKMQGAHTGTYHLVIDFEEEKQ